MTEANNIELGTEEHTCKRENVQIKHVLIHSYGLLWDWCVYKCACKKCAKIACWQYLWQSFMCMSYLMHIYHNKVFTFCRDFSHYMLKAIGIIGWFEWIFIIVQHSHSRHQKTTSSLLTMNLKGILRFSNEWPLDGELYVYIDLW